jgi:hypothetical protein
LQCFGYRGALPTFQSSRSVWSGLGTPRRFVGCCLRGCRWLFYDGSCKRLLSPCGGRRANKETRLPRTSVRKDATYKSVDCQVAARDRSRRGRRATANRGP